MYKGFRVIDADAHIAEPHDLWSDFVEPEFYERRPLVAPRQEGQQYRGRGDRFLPCELLPDGETPKGNLQGAGLGREPTIELKNLMPQKYGEAYEVEFTPESRLQDMERYGWDKQVLIDNAPIPLRSADGTKDQALVWACTRAYNNWARSFCDTDASKLKMAAVMPNHHDIAGLVAEGRRVIEGLGAVTITMPLAPKDRAWHDPAYDPFWKLAEELDFPVSFHGVMSGEPHVGTRYKPRHLVSGQEVALDHAIGFSFENMISLGHVVYMGILERFPELRVSFLEGNAGWLPFWLGRLDDHAVRGRRQGMWFDAKALPLKPSEYFLRQGFVACDPDEFALTAVVSLIGSGNIVWNTDYSHPDAPDPDKAVDMLLDQSIPEEAKRKILWDNPARLYGKRILN